MVTLNKAKRIISKAFEAGKAGDMKPLACVVLDAGGNIVAFERQDGASPGRFAIAHGKAYGAVMLGMAGRAQMARAEAQAYFIAAARDIPEVIEIQTFLGRVDVRLSVIARDMAHYQQVYRAQILTLPHINDIEALMHVARIKSEEALPL